MATDIPTFHIPMLQRYHNAQFDLVDNSAKASTGAHNFAAALTADCAVLQHMQGSPWYLFARLVSINLVGIGGHARSFAVGRS